MQRIIILLILILNYGISCLGQDLSTNDKRAEKYFNEALEFYRNRTNINALEKLYEALQRDDNFIEAYLLKADIYAELDSVSKQIESLKKVIEISPLSNMNVYYVLGTAYLKTGEYQKAKDSFQKYLEINPNGSLLEKAKQNLSKANFALNLYLNPVPYSANSLGEGINSEFNEYWPSITVDNETLVFTRLAPVESSNITFQEDFYTSTQNNGKWEKATAIIDINTTDNEGAQSISADGKLLFFTICSQSKGMGSCDIYFSSLENGVWSLPQNVGSPVNSSSWESQPSISANGEYLYFASNREGGKGGMDIWRCKLNGLKNNGLPLWSSPENLGDSINTSGDEMSPFIHSDNKTLYFASDSWPGMGGIDLFVSRQKNDESWTESQNLGYPINTWNDETGLIVNATGETAYFSTNRETAGENMDLYSFNMYDEIRPSPVSYVKGHILDKNTEDPLFANIQLIDLDNESLEMEISSDKTDGSFLMCLPIGKDFAFNVEKEGYLFYSESFMLHDAHSEDDPFITDIQLSPIEVGNSTILRNIFFDTDSYELLEQSNIELNKLVSFLKENPTIAIEIGGHTDSMGTEEYNMKLSEARAKSVFDFLENEGIPESRITYKGYGMTIPIDTNETDEGRANNRRTEFTITRN